MLLNTNQDIEHSGEFPTPLGTGQWVRIIFPGATDPEVKIDKPRGGLLSNALETLFDEYFSIKTVEVVTYPGHYQQEYLIRGHPYDPASPLYDKDILLEALDTIQTWEELKASDLEISTLYTAIAIKENIPGRFGVEIVTVDPGPLGILPTRTSRLVSSTTDPITLETKPPKSPFAAHIDALLSESTPHMARTIIDNHDSSGTYLLEQQLARFRRANHCLYPRDVVTGLQESITDTLGAVYDATELRSNYDATELRSNYDATELRSNYDATELRSNWELREEYDDISNADPSGLVGTHRRLQTYNFEKPLSEKQQALQQIVGDAEYDRLHGRCSDATQLAKAYETLDVTPTLTVDSTTLTGFLGLVPGYDFGRWNSGRYIELSQPVLETQLTLRAATGSDHDLTRDRRLFSPPTNVAEQIEEVKLLFQRDQQLLEQTIQAFEEYGDDLSTECQPYAAFNRETPDGEVEPIIVVTEETLIPGDLIATIENAPHKTATIITDTKATAHKVHDLLRQPYAKAHASQTVLYPQGTRYWLCSGGVAVLPADTTLRWILAPDGTLRLCADDFDIIAGSTTDFPKDPGEKAYRAHTDESQCVIVDHSGDEIERVSSIQSFLETYRPVPLPAVPSQLTYQDRATVFSLADGQLTRVHSTSGTSSQVDSWTGLLASVFLSHFCTIDNTDKVGQTNEPVTTFEFNGGFQSYIDSEAIGKMSAETKLRRNDEVIETDLSFTTHVKIADGRDKYLQYRYPRDISRRPPLQDTVLNANKVNTLIIAGFVEHTWPHIPSSVKSQLRQTSSNNE